MVGNTNSFAVIFDMDGVIVDSNPSHTIALRQFCRKHGYDLTEYQLKNKIYGRTNKDWLTNLLGDDLTDEQILKFEEEKEGLFRELFASEIKPLDGLVDFLEILKENKITVAIGTSAPAKNVEFTLEKTGIGHYFEIILDSSFISTGKPDPEIYIKTASAINYPPERCMVFEDSIAGVESAKRAGCKVIGVSTTHSADELEGTEFVIDDFTNITIEEIKDQFL